MSNNSSKQSNNSNLQGKINKMLKQKNDFKVESCLKLSINYDKNTNKAAKIDPDTLISFSNTYSKKKSNLELLQKGKNFLSKSKFLDRKKSCLLIDRVKLSSVIPKQNSILQIHKSQLDNQNSTPYIETKNNQDSTSNIIDSPKLHKLCEKNINLRSTIYAKKGRKFNLSNPFDMNKTKTGEFIREEDQNDPKKLQFDKLMHINEMAFTQKTEPESIIDDPKEKILRIPRNLSYKFDNVDDKIRQNYYTKNRLILKSIKEKKAQLLKNNRSRDNKPNLQDLTQYRKIFMNEEDTQSRFKESGFLSKHYKQFKTHSVSQFSKMKLKKQETQNSNQEKLSASLNFNQESKIDSFLMKSQTGAVKTNGEECLYENTITEYNPINLTNVNDFSQNINEKKKLLVKNFSESKIKNYEKIQEEILSKKFKAVKFLYDEVGKFTFQRDTVSMNRKDLNDGKIFECKNIYKNEKFSNSSSIDKNIANKTNYISNSYHKNDANSSATSNSLADNLFNNYSAKYLDNEKLNTNNCFFNMNLNKAEKSPELTRNISHPRLNIKTSDIYENTIPSINMNNNTNPGDRFNLFMEKRNENDKKINSKSISVKNNGIKQNVTLDRNFKKRADQSLNLTKNLNSITDYQKEKFTPNLYSNQKADLAQNFTQDLDFHNNITKDYFYETTDFEKLASVDKFQGDYTSKYDISNRIRPLNCNSHDSNKHMWNSRPRFKSQRNKDTFTKKLNDNSFHSWDKDRSNDNIG